jgi:hypothetical protein
MPHHYSAAKYQQSVRLKHRTYEVASKLFEYMSWEIIPNDVLQEIDEQAQIRVNKLVQQDQTVIWALPPDAVQLQAQFRLSEEMTLAARKKRSTVQTQAVGGPMPAELRGFVLTQTLKPGTMLCTAFNADRCYNTDDTCEGAHLCAVVLQSGRACGGKHPAKDCRGKRALTAERFQEMQPAAAPTEAKMEAKDEEESTTDESSSDISVTAPEAADSGAGSARDLPIQKAKATPKRLVQEDPNPKGPAKRAERPPSPKQPPKKKAKHGGESASSAAKSKPAPAASAKAKAEAEPVVRQLEIPAVVSLHTSDRRWDQLATVNGRTTEAPSLIFKMRNGGELWLSGIPTEATKGHFARVDLQVSCMYETPGERGGITLDGAQLMQFPIYILVDRFYLYYLFLLEFT